MTPLSDSASVHACAVLVGARAILIRGPAGSGKSRLALALIQAAETGRLPFARLLADDRVRPEAHHGRLELTRSDSSGTTFTAYLPAPANQRETH